VQQAWANRPLAARLAVLRQARRLIANRAADFMVAVDLGDRRLAAETVPLEIVPLLDALKFLERQGRRILATRRLGRAGRPLWLFGAEAEIRRLPLGRVLILAPFNYPLLLPGVQIVQALAAGNAVLVKPAPGHERPMTLLAECLAEAGLPAGLLTILDSIEAADAALDEGVGKIVLTGSAATGRAVLAKAAARVIPAIVELSGNDAVFVLPGADLNLTAKALVFGLRLNGGATCIAPRRIYARRDVIANLHERLQVAIKSLPPVSLPPAVATQAVRMLGASAVQEGKMYPAVVLAEPGSGLLCEDIFFPVLSLVPVDTMDEALALDAACPYRLGAAIFGPAAAAGAFSQQVSAGMVVINDLIAPTADPRLPFEGAGQSGFGPTRGAEGLLAMTRPQAVTLRHGRLRFHYQPILPRHAGFYLAFVRAFYAGGMGNIGRFLGEMVRFRA
jgi:acyl-CoA reductase-like NAD-dependent aldehyde dehydrogenase